MSQAQPLGPSDPREIGRYRLLGRLGEGGQGVVYLGEDPDGARAAVKTLNPAGMRDPGLRDRFVREAAAARRVASFCTAAVLDADFSASPPYIASEYVDGPPLSAVVRDQGPLTGGDLDRLAVNIATALVAVHEAGIVHRDLKPDNVLLAAGGARVIDFGVAQVPQAQGERTHTSIGTPAFMAPEQISGEGIGPHTDVFAWGSVVAFAATGRPPFAGDTVAEVLNRVVSAAPDLDGLPERLRAPVTAALDKNPSRRPSSQDLLMELLGRKSAPAAPAAAAAAAATVPVGAEAAPTRTEPPAGGRRTGPVAVVAVLALLAAAAAGAFFLVRGGSGGERPGAEAQATAEGSAAPDAESAPPSPSPESTGEPMPVPEFTADYEADWEGAVDGALWTLQVGEGDRTGTLENDDDDDCFYELSVVEGDTDPSVGLTAEVTETGQGEECTTAPADTARITLDEGILSVALTDADTPALDLRMRPEAD
ncbi:serine/threonine-protein kinase [Nocardiopsis potens]|uniref:serine/threonine-protein kinase n=1 Tax=Nocardiopsis potens TaxID=1246458 RepID=UPI000344F0A1|nr:serine/threonine-protein kinase [Nocardiopsis potens]